MTEQANTSGHTPNPVYDKPNRKISYIFIGLVCGVCVLSLYLTAMMLHPHQDLPFGHKVHESLLYFAIIALASVGITFYIAATKKTTMIQASRANMEAANALLENRLAAMELTLDGLFIVDKDGHLTYMNQRLINLHSIAPDAIDQYINKQWVNLYPPEVQTEIQSTVPQHLEHNNSWMGELKLSNEHAKTIELSLTKLPDGGLIGTSHDITIHKQANREHEQLQSQFYQAQKMEAIGRLAGGIAHDFNNILAAINVYGEFLVEDLNDRSAEQNFATKILMATSQAKKLVDQILTFSRKNDAKSEKVDLVSAISENISMVKASVMASITVTENIEINEAMIDGNSTQISQAIMNLCVNALDAMENTHGELLVELKPGNISYFKEHNMMCDTLEDIGEKPVFNMDKVDDDQTILTSGVIAKDHDYICLSIADTGTGISHVIMEHIFEPFFTTKPVDKGTGLGLATVHGVVLQHQGALVLDSKVGKGTRFDLYFPITQVKEKLDSGPAKDIGKFEFEGARILLVEDQETVRDMAARMLMRMGFEVIEAECGQTALETIKKYHEVRPFHLVLSDHSMPNMTGLELAIAVEKEYPDLPFVLLSGYSKEKLQDIMGDHHGIKAVLRKPIEKDILKEKLYAVLSGEDISLTVDPLISAA